MWNDGLWMLRIRAENIHFALPVTPGVLRGLIRAWADLASLLPTRLPVRQIADALDGMTDALFDTGGMPLLDIEAEGVTVRLAPISSRREG